MIYTALEEHVCNKCGDIIRVGDKMSYYLDYESDTMAYSHVNCHKDIIKEQDRLFEEAKISMGKYIDILEKEESKMALKMKAVAYKGTSKIIADATYIGLNSLSQDNFIVPQKDGLGNQTVYINTDLVLDHAERFMDGEEYVVMAYMKAAEEIRVISGELMTKADVMRTVESMLEKIDRKERCHE